MDPLGIIAATKEGIGLIKAASEAVKSIKDVAASGKPDSKQIIDATTESLREQLLELQNKYLALQEMAIDASQKSLLLVQENAALNEKLAKSDQFEASRELFERVSLALNTSAYREKAFSGPADELPLFCPQCFDSGKKTYLSFHEHAMHTKHLKCASCGTSVHVARDDGPAVMIARVRRTTGWDDL